MGKAGWAMLRPFNIKLELHCGQSNLSVADGRACTIIGILHLEVEFDGVKRWMKFFVVPSLSHVLVLGIDFWRPYQLKVDIASNSVARGSDEGFCDHHVDKIMNFKIDELVVSDDPLSRNNVKRFKRSSRSTVAPWAAKA